jgi:hypothetical protein
MRKNFAWVLMLAMVLGVLQPVASAQDDKAKTATPDVGWNFYKLDFVVRELEDGKSVNARNYTLMTRSNDWQQLRVGTRVPVTAGKTNQLQYVDVGLQVDCRIMEERGREIPALSTKAEITSIATNDADKSMSTVAPVIRRVQMQVTSPITIGKPVVISGVDELNSKHRFQLEVTVTKAP